MTAADNQVPAERVRVDRPEEQSLLGLLMRDVRLKAGDMVITLRFAEGSVTLLEGPTERPRAQVAGTMAALLGVARGGGLVGPLLSGAVAFGGNPFLLLRLLPLLRARGGQAPDQDEKSGGAT